MNVVDKRLIYICLKALRVGRQPCESFKSESKAGPVATLIAFLYISIGWSRIENEIYLQYKQ